MSERTPDSSGLTDPVRHPESASAPVRTKRAWVLLLLTVLVPGGAQLVAGSKRLGRRALRVTLTCWFLLLAVAAVAVLNRSILIELLARPAVQLVLVVVLGLLAVGWLVLFINTLAIIRPRLLAPGMRGIVAGASVVAVLATSGVLGYGAFVLNTGRGTIQNVFASGPAFDPVDGRYNIMLLGGDAGANRVGLRPDTMSLFSIDAATGKTAVISFPRNFQRAPFPAGSPLHDVYPEGFSCGDECILNALYPTVENEHADVFPAGSNAGAEAMMDAAEGITGLKVQGYVLVDMAGFEQFIDAMGGVTVDSGGWVPYRGAPRDDTFVRTRWFAPGELKLDGQDALWFARSRYFTTDYHRIRRQQCLQQAMINQFNPQTVLTRFTDIMSAGEELVETNIPQDQLGSFLNLADKARKSPFERLTLGAPDFGTSAERFSTFPDFDRIHTRVDALLLAASGAAPASSAPASASTDGQGGAGASGGGSGASPSAGGGQAGSGASTPAPSSTDAIEQGADAVPSTQPDGSPITEDYLVRLEELGREDQLSLIAANNNECSTP
ncbi:LCP family protein [Zafaria sp. Z1313]|uniref:LCP family protein n=1 Tax=unclassified Zafaria TaxID=2828765 RepID=UPI002E791A17|nr:LCP family protein [Zafaria sp. J156]MEE1619941.1 LCP family protein [Zafaria sp. J156]